MASKKVKCKASEDASKLIRENMKCPVCMEVLLPPIYQCETGHNICYLCVDEVTECPLCKGDYGDTRNYFAEELVNSMSFPCKFEDYGCTKILPGSELKDHQDTCEFQPYRCPELACQEVAGLHQMAKHLDRHGFKIMKGDVQQASIDIQDDHFDRKTEYNPWRILAFNREFYTVSTRQKDGSWYFWSYCLGLPKDTKKFSYEIIVFCEDKQILYRGLVHSLRVEPDDIMSQGNCLTLTDNVVKSLKKNGKITCRVRFIQGRNWDTKIEKLKKPAAAAKAALKDPKINPSFKGKMKIPSTPPSASASPSNVASTFNSITPLRQLKAKLANYIRLPPTPPPSATGKREATTSQSKGNAKDKDIPVASSSSRSLKKVNTNHNHVQAKITDEEQNFVTKMRETLRCPGCNETISPPVHQCIIGHNVCYNCKLARSDCAVCRAPIGASRNFFAEELLYKVYQRCSYATKGCKVVLPSAQMRSHEGSCDFAPFDCPFNACRKLVGPNELFSHLKSHQISVMHREIRTHIEVPKTYPTGGPVCTIPHILWSHNTPFYPTIVREPGGTWTFSVSGQDHGKYRYEVTLVKMSKTLSFQAPVLSLRMNQTQVDQGGLSLVLPENMINSLKYDGRLTYCIRIFSSSERVPEDSVFAFHACLKQGPRALAGQTELFANKKTSVSAADDDEDEEGTDNVLSDDSETRLSELYDAESDEQLEVVEVELLELKDEVNSQLYSITVQSDHGTDEILALDKEFKEDSTTTSRVNSELENCVKSDQSVALSVPIIINPEKKLTVVTSEIASESPAKKHKHPGGGRKRSKSRPKLSTRISSSSTTIGDVSYTVKSVEEPNLKSETSVKIDEDMVTLKEPLGEEGHDNIVDPEEKIPITKHSVTVHSIGVGDNYVHSLVMSTQTTECIQESCQVGNSLTNLISSSTVVPDADYYDISSSKEVPSLLSNKNVDKVVEILGDGVNDIYDMSAVITDGFNAVKNVVDKVDMEVITDGLSAVTKAVNMEQKLTDGFNAVKSVVDMVGTVGRFMQGQENEEVIEEGKNQIQTTSESQDSIDPEVD